MTNKVKYFILIQLFVLLIIPFNVFALENEQTSNVSIDDDNFVRIEVKAENIKKYRWYFSNNNGEEWIPAFSSWKGYNSNKLELEMNNSRIKYVFKCTMIDLNDNVIESEIIKISQTNFEGKIIEQSDNVSVDDDNFVRIEVKAENIKKYRWYFSNNNGEEWIPAFSSWKGYNSNKLELEMNNSRIKYVFKCAMIDLNDNVIESGIIKISQTNFEGKIIEQPDNVSVDDDNFVRIEVKAENIKKYRWYFSNNNGEEWIPAFSSWKGYNSNKLELEMNNSRINYLFKCIMTDLNDNVIESDVINVYEINVTDYKIYGDGVTDNSQALKELLIKANGKKVFFPKGIYIVSNSIELKNVKVNIYSNNNAKIQLKSKISNNRCMDIINSNSIIIKNMLFDGDRLGYGERGNLAGIWIYDSNNVEIYSNTFSNIYKEAITLTTKFDKGKNILKNIKIINNKFYNTSDNLWVLSKIDGLSFENNYSDTSRGTGIEFIDSEYSKNVNIRGNVFKNFAEGNAIKIYDVENVNIENNKFIDCLWGVRIFFPLTIIENSYSVKNVVISNNEFIQTNLTMPKNTPISFNRSYSVELADDKYLYDNVSIFNNIIDTQNGMVLNYIDKLYLEGNNSSVGVSNNYNLYHNNEVSIDNDTNINDSKAMINIEEINNIYISNLRFYVDENSRLYYVSKGIPKLYLNNVQSRFGNLSKKNYDFIVQMENCLEI